MVFSSLIFIAVFLPLYLSLYWAAGGVRLKNIVLIIFSLSFYAWGEPRLVFLLVCVALVNFLFGRLLEYSRGSLWSHVMLATGLAANLGTLGFFKYSSFLVETVNDAFSMGVTWPTVVLPIGISFYTFQCISYLADVYRGKVESERSFLSFLLYVSLFHQLIAGPIVRYESVAREISDRAPSSRDVYKGAARFCRGLFKKVCLANIAAEQVDTLLGSASTSLSTAVAWYGILLFSLQIYYDFSGYSDMAIGLGRMAGFHFPENFNYPYIARSATEFWRRWHMTLGQFFRDYVYIPMGGRKRHGLRNLVVVWFLTGLWHGASWNYALWGLYYGTLIAVERLFLRKLLDALPRAFGHAYLIVAVAIGWALFYFEDTNRLLEFLPILIGYGGGVTDWFLLEARVLGHIGWLTMALALCLPVGAKIRSVLAEVAGARPGWAVAVEAGALLANVTLLIVAVSYLVADTYNPFLYYRF